MFCRTLTIRDVIYLGCHSATNRIYLGYLTNQSVLCSCPLDGSPPALFYISTFTTEQLHWPPHIAQIRIKILLLYRQSALGFRSQLSLLFNPPTSVACLWSLKPLHRPTSCPCCSSLANRCCPASCLCLCRSYALK